jgi:hypothetical protein
MWFGDGARGTGDDTALASPATRLLGPVGWQLERGQNFSEEEPGPEFWIDQHCALAVPAHARFRGVIALEDWTRVDVTFLGAATLGEKHAEFLEFPQHQVVIIVAPRVTRDSASCRIQGW